MPEDRFEAQTGNIGEDAVVQIGQNLTNVSIQLTSDPDAARRLLLELRYRHRCRIQGYAVPRLDDRVLDEHPTALAEVAHFFDDREAWVLYVVGPSGIGKTRLAR